ncbi:MAG: hypothetical protein E4G99_12495 [Anaerolineales bacterium]|nr:MAG: hypothetical protein E4G99_12495 [Anaerolineales bacterium]
MSTSIPAAVPISNDPNPLADAFISVTARTWLLLSPVSLAAAILWVGIGSPALITLGFIIA